MKCIHNIVAALRSDLCLHRTLNDGTGVVVDLAGSKVLALNATGMFLVEALAAGADSVDELIEALTGSFEVDRATAERDVRELLEQLDRHLKRPAEEHR